MSRLGFSDWLWIAGALAAFLWLAREEARRPDRRRRGMRVVAVGVACAALAGLGRFAFRPWTPPADGRREAVLLTAGAAVTGAGGGRLALPEAASPSADARIVPDAAFLRREFPALAAVRIEGLGVETGDAESLHGLAIAHQPPASAAGPAIAALHVPRELVLGERLEVQGRVRGLAPGQTISLALEGPDGTTRSTEVAAAGEGGAAFVLDGGTPVAAGTHEWRLRLGAGGETVAVGVAVVPPELPRVLFWESAPSFDSGRLRRWLADAGARVAARTQVSVDRVRTATVGVEGGAERLDAALLEGFDVVIADVPALAALAPAERAALQVAVRDGGLGLLLTAEGFAPQADDFFAPWTLAQAGSGEEIGEERRARLRLPGGSELAEPVAVADAAIAPAGGTRSLVRDPLDRTLAAMQPRGRGRIALTLVYDSWRWLQGGQAGAFAAYWSQLLSAVARPQAGTGSWRLRDAAAEPVFVDQPVHLVWTGPADQAPSEVRIESRTATESVTLALRGEAGERAGTFWPRQSGWHRVTAVDGGRAFDFFVQPPETLPGVRLARREQATVRLMVDSPAAGTEDAARERAPFGSGPPWPEILFALLLAASAGLWLESRVRRPEDSTFK